MNKSVDCTWLEFWEFWHRSPQLRYFSWDHTVVDHMGCVTFMRDSFRTVGVLECAFADDGIRLVRQDEAMTNQFRAA